MSSSGKTILTQFSARRILIPVLLGIGVLAIVFIRKFDREAFAQIQWSWLSLLWLGIAIVMIGLRQFFYMWRIRFLTDDYLSWKASFQVILLWEFGSAATPTAVGGTTVALLLLIKEGIQTGKAIAIDLCTILLDMSFLLLALIVAVIVFSFNELLPGGHVGNFNRAFFALTFVLLLGYTILVGYGLFGRPAAVKWMLVKVMSLKWLRRWQHKAVEIGDQLIAASAELRHRNAAFWIKSFLMTAGTWTARFLIANCLIMIVTPLDEHLLLFFRQIALMVILMMVPSPGGSGFAEISFPAFISDMVPAGLVATVTALWRSFTFYPYLLMGLVILPRWVNRVFHVSNRATTG
ncbi:MAG: hypothetical protein KatS3mg031_1216 [Chitinophagales bacterium]|nr:MAG: hypothetical protein KatS3mg031_1216 [Chitinophagales bacterium]